jgi:hypothetical protein
MDVIIIFLGGIVRTKVDNVELVDGELRSVKFRDVTLLDWRVKDEEVCEFRNRVLYNFSMIKMF